MFGGHVDVSARLVLCSAWLAWGMGIVSLLALVSILRRHAASAVAALLLAVPAVTAIGSALALGEALHPASLVGMLVALAGIGAVLRREAAARRVARAPARGAVRPGRTGALAARCPDRPAPPAGTVRAWRRLFVTGLGGYLGSELGRRAPAAGWEVDGDRGLRRSSTSATARGARRGRAPRGPDVVVHTAYRMDDPSVNVEGTRAVAAAAVAAGARLVHLSSDLVFAGSRDAGADRGRRAATRSRAYGASKLEAERLCPPDALLVRTSLIYGGPEPAPQERAGPRGRRRRARHGLLHRRAALPDRRGRPRRRGARARGARRSAGPLHVAGADALSRLEFARLVCAHHGRDPASLRGAPGGPERPKHLVLDCSRARALLRVRLRGAREVLAA